MKRFVKTAVSAVALSAAAFASAGDNAAWVADPYRAAGAKWKRHSVKGHDFWHLLEPSFRTLDGVKDLPMVRDAGVQYVQIATDPVITGFSRRICVYGVDAKDEKGVPVPATFEMVSDEPGVTIDKGDGFTVLSAPYADVKVRYLPTKCKITVRAERPFMTIDIRHGSAKGSMIADVERASAPAEIALSRRNCRLSLKKPMSELSLDVASSRPQLKMTGIANEAALRERLERVPFTIVAPYIIWSCIGAPDGYLQWREAINDIAARYPETFLGVEITEWDSNFLQKIKNAPTSPQMRDLMKVREIPTDRNGMVNNMALHFDNYANLFGDRLSAMSGGLNFQLYSGDFGAKIICTEVSGERWSKSQRLEIMYTISAARQFGTPASIYIAYYSGAQHPSSRGSFSSIGASGTDWGQAPSMTTRNFYPFYYMGGNFMTFESQPYGQVEPVAGKKDEWKLSGNGKAIDDLYRWSRSETGVRGDGYAPILLLEDRRSGNDQAWPLERRLASFYGMFDSTDGDVMTEYIMRAISSPNGHESAIDPAGGTCHFNSSLGNVFNMALANPLRSPEVKDGHLAKYAAVVVAGDLDWSESLANRIKRYVAEGGTLVLTAGQSHPFDAEFLGASASLDNTVEADGLVVCKAKLRDGTRILKTTSGGLPLVTASRYGAGQVDFVLSPFFRKAAVKNAKPEYRFIAPPQVKEVLEAVQDAVLPIKVKGDCEFTLNKADDGSWRVCLVNNLGSSKDPKSSVEKLFPEWAQDVTLTLPAGAKAEDVRLGVKPVVDGCDWTFKVPPAGVLVVKVDSVDAMPKGVQSEIGAKAYSPVKNFTRRFAVTGRPNDGFRYDPAVSPRRQKGKAPAMIGEWLAKNGFRDTSGNGHDMTVTGKFGEKDGAAFADKESTAFALASFKADYPLHQATIETWVKPSVNQTDFTLDKGGRGRQGGVLFLKDGLEAGWFNLYCCNGHWACATMGGRRRLDVFGPEVKDEWTHLAVAFDNEIVRFYVNGKEVVGPDGPLRRLSDQALESVQHLVYFIYGSAHPDWKFFFRGGMKGLKFHSRCFSAEEIAEKSRELW